MNIVVAPDKFKGTLSASEVCAVIEDAAHSIQSDWHMITVPMADGGEGTCDILTTISQGRKITCKARDPLMREVSTSFGISANGKTAFIEMASASGLKWLSSAERNPAHTTTVGTGDLIRHALDYRVSQVVLGIGGSATNDAGAGMAYALGSKFYTSRNEEILPFGKDLSAISRIDHSSVDARIGHTDFTVLCDVDSPLYGQRGATFTYGPQKGARREDLQMLDDGLKWIAALAKRESGVDLNFAGAGAAGGLGAGARLFLRANIVSGIDFMIDFAKLKEQIANADLVITGEGKLDQQTLRGKVVSGIAQLGRELGKPVWVVTGQNELTESELATMAISRVISLTDEGTSEEEAFSHAREVLFGRTARALSQNFSKTRFE